MLGLSLAACAPEGDSTGMDGFAVCEALPNELGRIEVAGSGFGLNGEAVQPHGVGSYPLLQHVGAGELGKVRDVFAQARALGRPLIRTNAFMDGGSNPARIRDADGTLREEGLRALDLLIAEASEARVRLLLVLTNNWPDYGGAPFMVNAFTPGLPKDAFWSDGTVMREHQTFLRRLVERTNSVNGVPYAEEPAVFAWELANEARCDTPGFCDSETLVRWARVMSEELRQAGALQPIAWGGSGYVGRYGEDLRLLAADGAVDILTVHIYPESHKPSLRRLPVGLRVPLVVGLGLERMHEALRVSRQFDLPLLLEEFGWRPPHNARDQDAERAQVYEAWLAMAHAEGIATLPWMIAEQGREDYDGFLIRPEHEYTWAALTCEPPPEL